MYSRVGGGHLSAARAIAAELEATGHCTARLVDVYLECGRFPVTLFPRAYAWLARNHPRLWATVYRVSALGPNPTPALRPFLRAGLERMVSIERPDLVISVLPGINELLADAAATNSARLEVVLTDWHSVHPLWQARGVDHYSVPTQSAREDCIRSGAAPSAIDVVGIPIRRDFAEDSDRETARSRRLAELGLDPRVFTVLAMVGAEGSPRALDNIACLAGLELDAQLVVICGRNDELRQHVQRLPVRIPLRALGFVDDVADLMQAADLVVTKPGGLTLAEAFARRVPVVVHDVLPGQEAGNLEYVLREAAVAYAPDAQTLARVVTQLYTDTAERLALAERGARLARPEAARQIARNILARLDA